MNKKLLKELFDLSVPFEKKRIYGGTRYSFLVNNKWGINVEIIGGDRPGEFAWIDFTNNGFYSKQSEVSLDDSLKIWSTIKDCLKDFIRTYPSLGGFDFSATDANEKFYSRVVPKLASELGFTLSIRGDSFKLTNPTAPEDPEETLM